MGDCLVIYPLRYGYSGKLLRICFGVGDGPARRLGTAPVEEVCS